MKSRRMTIGAAALLVALAACNALLGNDEPTRADPAGADAVSPDAPSGDVVIDGPADAPGDVARLDASADADADADADAALPSCSPVAGSKDPCVVLGGLPGPITSLSASKDGKHIYWGDLQPGEVQTVDLTKPIPAVVGLATQSMLPARRVSASNQGVYVAANTADRIRYVTFASDGGAAKLITSIAVTVTNLAFVDSSGAKLLWSEGPNACFFSDDLGAAAPARNLETGFCNGTPIGVTATGDYRAWLLSDGRLRADRLGPANDFMSTSSTEGLALGGGSGFAGGGGSTDELFFAYRDTVFIPGTTFFDQVAGAAVKARIPLPGGDEITSIVADATRVYWAMRPGYVNSSTYSIHRALRSSFITYDRVAMNQAGVADVAVAGGELYWTREEPPGKWQLVKLPK